MLKSMTGFGRGESQKSGYHYVVRLKSVNNRFLENGLKLPPNLWTFEAEAKAMFNRHLSRGKIEAAWRQVPVEGGRPAVCANLPTAEAYLDAIRKLGEKFQLKVDVKAESLARFPEVVLTERSLEDDEEEDLKRWQCLKEALEQALQAMDESRQREGAAMEKEIRRCLSSCSALVKEVEELSHKAASSFKEKIEKRLSALLEKAGLDEARLAMEAGFLADKADIREEIVRFNTHVAEFERLLGKEDIVGKRLDFLSQEMLREANTMGSKSPDAALSHKVVSLKSEIERIKEQIQNVE